MMKDESCLGTQGHSEKDFFSTGQNALATEKIFPQLYTFHGTKTFSVQI